MRSFVWLTLGVVGFFLGYSTRADQGFSTVRLVGFVLLAVGSLGLLPRYPDEPVDPEPARSAQAQAAAPHPELAGR